MKSGTSTTTHLPGFSHIGQLNLILLIGQESVLEWLVRLRGRGSIQYIEVDKQCYGDHIIKNWNHNNILYIRQPYCVACVVVYFSGQAGLVWSFSSASTTFASLTHLIREHVIFIFLLHLILLFLFPTFFPIYSLLVDS